MQMFLHEITFAKLVALGQVEGLHPVLSDIQVQSFPHVERFTLAGVGVSNFGREETYRLVVGSERVIGCNRNRTMLMSSQGIKTNQMLRIRYGTKLVRLHCIESRLVITRTPHD